MLGIVFLGENVETVRQRVYRSDVINTYEQKRSLFFQDKKEEEEEKVDSSLGRILKLNKPETIYIILGCIGSLVNGGVMPGFAIIFSEILGVSLNLVSTAC